MRKLTWGIRAHLPKIYTGEGWLMVKPISLQVPVPKADVALEFESQVNVFGFFLWNLWIARFPDGEFNFSITVLGFGFLIFRD